MADMDVDALLEKALDGIEKTDKKNGSAEEYIKDKLSKKDRKKDRDRDDKKRRSRSKSRSKSKEKAEEDNEDPVQKALRLKWELEGKNDIALKKKMEERRRRSRSTDRDRKRRKRTRSSSSESDSDRSRSRSRSRDRRRRKSRSKSRDRRRKRSSSRSERRRRSRSRDRSRERRRHSRSNSSSRRRRSRSRSNSRSYRRSSPRPRVIDHRRSPPPAWRRERSPPRRPAPGPERRDVMPFTASKPPPMGANENMTVEERDDRTVFVQQLARDTRPRDLEEFFSSVGHVRDVRVITDSRTRRSKGIAYVEFWERESVPLALGLSGQRLLGAPLIITTTMAHINRNANQGIGGAIGFTPIPTVGSLKLCIANLHPSINEDMLGAIFEPFGRIDRVEIPMERGQNMNKGYGYVKFRHADDAKRALEQLNGFELAGKPMRVTNADEEDAQEKKPVSNGRNAPPPQRAPAPAPPQPAPPAQQPRAPPPQRPQAQVQPQPQQQQQHSNPNIPPIATQCFMLTNMFDPSSETEDGWDLDVRDDVIDECTEHGGVVHIFVDKMSSQGNVYVKCPTTEVAYKSVNALHGRWFAGKVITANYVPVDSYHALFPDSSVAVSLLKSRPRA